MIGVFYYYSDYEFTFLMSDMIIPFMYLLVTGGEALGAMLMVNKTLTKLDLSWNYIRLASAEAIAMAFEVNHTLRSLMLAYNSFGDKPCQVKSIIVSICKLFLVSLFVRTYYLYTTGCL